MIYRVAFIVLLSLATASFGETSPAVVEIVTDSGSIVIEVDREHAPVTAANFLYYVEHGFYDGGRFHRTVTPDNQPDNAVKIEVVQGGIDPAREAEERAPIALERTRDTGLAHRDGTVSMARAEPDTATSDFFICIGDQPSLDFGGARNPDGQGFAAFGRVVSGMEVVRRIQAAPAEGQKLVPPVAIRSAKRSASHIIGRTDRTIQDKISAWPTSSGSP